MEQQVAKRIERESATLTEFGAHIEPALRVEPGERFMVETQDNFFGEIRTEEDLRDSLWTGGFRVDRIYGGWGREPVGLSEDGELIVIANAEISPRS